MTRITVLILAAALFPVVWGWCVYYAMRRFWPARWASSGSRGDSAHRPAAPIDYQI
jgi:hypothetical protein